jgi:hypothetical protein
MGHLTAKSLKRNTARIAVSLGLFAVPVAASGCGAGTHLAENVAAHAIANHFAKTPAQKRDVNRAFCALSVYQAFKDVTHHHLVYGALTAHQALKDCESGFSKNAG